MPRPVSLTTSSTWEGSGRTPRQTRPPLVRLRAGELYRGAPAVDLALVEIREFSRAQVMDAHAELLEGRDGFRLRDNRLQLGGDSLDDRLRRAAGGHDAGPRIDVEIRKAGLRQRRRLRKEGAARAGGHGEQAYLA